MEENALASQISETAAPAVTLGPSFPEPSLLEQNPYGLQALWEQGDLVLKCVALILLLMSIASWYIIASRGLRAMRLRRAAQASTGFWHAHSLEEGLKLLGNAPGSKSPFRHLVEEGIHARDHHLARTQELHGQLSMAEWLTACLRTAIDESAERMQSGLSVLASVGSTAPFIGLFGTVWGIMNSFTAIAQSNDTSLAVVAPGIAEALFATALGLVAAIPAVIAYNKLTTDLGRAAQRLNAGIVALAARVSRDVPHRVGAAA